MFGQDTLSKAEARRLSKELRAEGFTSRRASGRGTSWVTLTKQISPFTRVRVIITHHMDSTYTVLYVR